jgi:hypothetical protein
MKTFLLIVVLGAMLAAATILAVRGWMRLEGVEMSLYGVIALVLGVVLSLALGIGLMALVFISSRKGFDQ